MPVRNKKRRLGRRLGRVSSSTQAINHHPSTSGLPYHTKTPKRIHESPGGEEGGGGVKSPGNACR